MAEDSVDSLKGKLRTAIASLLPTLLLLLYRLQPSVGFMTARLRQEQTAGRPL